MEVAREDEEFDQATSEADRPAESPVEEATINEREMPEGEPVAREHIRPYLFDMPLLRLVRFAFGAALCTAVFNSPWSLPGLGTVANVERARSAADPAAGALAAAPALEPAPQAARFEAARPEPELPLQSEKVAATIAPSAATKIVRAEMKRAAREAFAAEVPPDADKAHLVRSEAKRGDALAAAGPAGAAAPTAPVEVRRPAAPQAAQAGWTHWVSVASWDASALPHIILAAAVLVGFMVHLRRCIGELLLGIPELAARVRPKLRA